ncbi:methionyl-tRNA formyltransferase [Flaviaesturariibacter amylovorans]|uniref:Methionyl-tRNA formyltransferase n=1 Tax=Flaviaesturariibacter amylovorans TaxID=1084520 RepID=A0ABP8GFT5_9BACT
MNVLVLTNNCASLPVLGFLADRKLLSAIIAPLPANADTPILEDWAAGRAVTFFRIEKHLLEEELRGFTSAFPNHLVLSFCFPWRIPTALLADGPSRFFNVHFSLLPQYAGPTPLFWQLRDGCTKGGVTLHQLTSTLDGGPVAGSTVVPLLPGENEGLYSTRLAAAAVPLVQALVTELQSGRLPRLTPQPAEDRSYRPRPRAEDLYIYWDRFSGAETEQLVNASNPGAGGALTFFRGQPVRLLEVTPADGAVAAGTPGGTIVHADAAQGLFVICADGGLLRLNVLGLREGWYSGGKLSALGFRAGDRFDLPPQQQPVILSPSFIHH